VIREPLYLAENKRNQNVLKWAALLHDIAKRTIPVFEGRDHVHPFISANVVIDVM